jgi:predicted nuclease of predicted toxin-antitoxin system
MKILADENVARPIVDRLRKEGHEVEYIFDTARGSVDIDILERANREGALLLNRR